MLLQKQVEKLTVQHEELSRQVHGDRRMSHAISQPAIHSGNDCTHHSL